VASASRRWAGVPIGAQVVILLVISLLAAEVISLAVVFAIPPPRPAVYRLSELAEAFRGGALQTRFGRPLVRSTAPAPPPRPPASEARAPFRDQRARTMLAAMLQAPVARVRLSQRREFQLLQGRPFGARVFELRRDRPGSPPEPPAERPGPPPGFDPGQPPVVGYGGGDRAFFGGPRPGLFFGREDIVGDFVAAVQQPSGQWTILRPSPEPFPNDWQRRVALWLFGCALVMAPVGWLFARRITAPFDRFAKAAEALGRDPNAPSMELTGPSEIDKAARAFNDMQARIRRYVGDRTAMVGAISHDLRTPLARIRFKLEGADEGLRRAVLSDVEKMEQMIAAVLAFIRDASEPRQRQRLDLLSLVECVADDAASGGADVEIVRGYPYAVEGDPIGLQRMLANLVDNAVKYAGHARIAMVERQDEAVVEIADGGPGLPAAELERVFQPFYRSSEARTLSDRGGVGLGLSVARTIARAHGGDVELERASPGLIARVRLPLAQP
jgi:two-component system OmpR family sensor kinase